MLSFGEKLSNIPVLLSPLVGINYHHHSGSVLLYSSTSCTPASVIEKLVWSYMWYGESTIIAIRTFHAFLRRILYVVAWPITFPPVGRKPSLPAEIIWLTLDLISSHNCDIMYFS